MMSSRSIDYKMSIGGEGKSDRDHDVVRCNVVRWEFLGRDSVMNSCLKETFSQEYKRVRES